MKRSLQFLVLGALLSTLAQPVLADEQAANNLAAANTTTATSTTSADSSADKTKAPKVISMSNVLQQLQKVGYIVKNAEFDKDSNKYKIDVVDRLGDKQSLEVDATKGLTADQKKVPHDTSIVQATKKLEKNGSIIKSITLNSDNYSATVIDKQGNETTYTIDLKTGKVTTG